MFNLTTQIWKGATVAIIGGGPSLTQEQVDYVRSRGLRTIGVNDAYQFGVAIDVCFWGDRKWFFGNEENGHPGHGQQIIKWPGLKVTCSSDCMYQPGVITLIRETLPGLQPPPRIKWYNNSGWTAVGLAVMMGAKKVVLLGFDGRADEGRYNWHADNVSGAEPCVFPLHAASGRECAEDIANWCLATGQEVSVWNCTPDSAYDAFPSADLKEVLP